MRPEVVEKIFLTRYGKALLAIVVLGEGKKVYEYPKRLKGLGMGTMYGAIQALEQWGLVRLDNGRVFLTTIGRQIAQKLYSIIEEYIPNHSNNEGQDITSITVYDAQNPPEDN